MSTRLPAHRIAHHHARLDAVSLHYATAGDGDPVVLLHGWPSTWYEWRHVMPPLAARHRVIAPDLRGLGDSSRPLDGYDKKTVAADLWQLLSGTLGLARWHLVGHDWGGPVAFALAAAHPEAIRTLAIVDVTLPGIGPDISQGGKRWHHAFHMTPDLPEAVNMVIQRATAKNPADRYPDVLNMIVDLRQALRFRMPSSRSAQGACGGNPAAT